MKKNPKKDRSLLFRNLEKKSFYGLFKINWNIRKGIRRNCTDRGSKEMHKKVNGKLKQKIKHKIISS